MKLSDDLSCYLSDHHDIFHSLLVPASSTPDLKPGTGKTKIFIRGTEK